MINNITVKFIIIVKNLNKTWSNLDFKKSNEI
jgi:hypothetical protein